MRSDYAFYLALAAIVLFSAAVFLPDNSITGNAVLETESCYALGCSELCELGDECGTGLVCCPTAWESGVCEYPENCGVIAEISLETSLEEYAVLHEEAPQAFRNISWKTFWIPLLVVIGICFLVIFSGRKKR